MRFLLLLLALFVAPTFTACHKHTRIVEEGEQGERGDNGLDGLSFDYVRGVNGATICEGVALVDARYVLPGNILSLAPEELTGYPLGLTLTFGTVDSPVRVYLVPIRAGATCVFERDLDPKTDSERRRWELVGQLKFEADGYLAVIPPEMLSLLDLATVSDYGITLEWEGECTTLDLNPRRLKFAPLARVMLGAD